MYSKVIVAFRTAFSTKHDGHRRRAERVLQSNSIKAFRRKQLHRLLVTKATSSPRVSRRIIFRVTKLRPKRKTRTPQLSVSHASQNKRPVRGTRKTQVPEVRVVSFSGMRAATAQRTDGRITCCGGFVAPLGRSPRNIRGEKLLLTAFAEEPLP